MLGTILSVQEVVVPRIKASKDYCTLLLGGNTSGDNKIKPLILYHSENTWGHMNYSDGFCLVYGDLIRKLGLQQAYFNLILPWTSSWNEGLLWESDHTLLLIDNAPGQSPRICDNDNMTIMFLLSDTPFFIQPVDQGSITILRDAIGRHTSSWLRTQLMVKTVRTNFLWKISGAIFNLEKWLKTLEMHGCKCYNPAWMEFVEIFCLM